MVLILDAAHEMKIDLCFSTIRRRKEHQRVPLFHCYITFRWGAKSYNLLLRRHQQSNASWVCASETKFGKWVLRMIGAKDFSSRSVSFFAQSKKELVSMTEYRLSKCTELYVGQSKIGSYKMWWYHVFLVDHYEHMNKAEENFFLTPSDSAA